MDPSKEVPRFLAPSADGKTSGGDWRIKRRREEVEEGLRGEREALIEIEITFSIVSLLFANQNNLYCYAYMPTSRGMYTKTLSIN